VFLCALAVTGTAVGFGARYLPTREGPDSPEDGSEDEDGSLPYPPPRRLPPDAASEAHLKNLSFRLTDLLTPEQSVLGYAIRDRAFDNCTIHGPVMLMFTRESRSRLSGSVFVEESSPEWPDSMLYELESNRTRQWFGGVVVIERCVFRSCTFVDIGIMADGWAIQAFKDHIAGKGGANIGFF
jgi:hypothetical protein